MKLLMIILNVWVLWLYSYREYSVIGTFKSLEECKAAAAPDLDSIMRWKTECKEAK
ncbi:hypothetical protein LEP1GSC047_2882 [Leptospira inadai serovar Lyme str. 10]|uniref:Uncharacterized protein n=1 Tax=Leptospira inadai serovar Lyme str. 10 TaxID=1049790 RepID=V6HAC3_9LEPT|nr:hypothetical protein [Leptospira inadai]EQA36316.1 hypothetical protein LEP1GSC047_2882 [Leptospira inadai serovar Lyme str. 10]